MDISVRRTFAALSVRNYRLFITGQGISLCGTWMQTVGLSWLVLQLTHSGTQLGLVIAAQTLPVLLLGVWGGVIADSFDKRSVLYVTQISSGILALILGLLVVTHVDQLWMIYVIAAGFGLINSFDSPTRQSFVIEMVGDMHLKNAVTLNSTMVNMARIVGPSIAGFIIATVGIGACFLLNAASYVAVLIALKRMDESKLSNAPRTSARKRGQIRAGLAYVWANPVFKSTLIMMFIIGTFAYELPVVLPLFATVTMHGGANTFSAMFAATGIGAIAGGLYTAGKADIGKFEHVVIAELFGVSILITSIMPGLASALIALFFVGVLSVLFIALGNTNLQLTSDPGMRGRVMSLWAIAFLGTTPIGGPIIGFVSDHTSPRVGLAVGGVSALMGGWLGYLVCKSSTSEDRQSSLE